MTAPLPTRPAPGVQHRRFGDVFVTALADGYLQIPAERCLNADAAEVARLSRLGFGPAQPYSAINAYLVRTADRTVLIDTGGGVTMGSPTAGQLDLNLKAADVSPADVDIVLLTHMHIDHLGGAIDANGRAVFPNAELVAPAAEAAFWLDEANAARAPEDRKAAFAVPRRVVDAYAGRYRTVEDGALPPGITPHPLPGHTPGHTGYRVGAGADQVLIWGDVFHLPALQVRRPEIGLSFDSDPAQAQSTRRATLDMAASERLMVAGMHMDFPGFAFIDRAADGYALVWSAWAHRL